MLEKVNKKTKVDFKRLSVFLRGILELDRVDSIYSD